VALVLRNAVRTVFFIPLSIKRETGTNKEKKGKEKEKSAEDHKFLLLHFYPIHPLQFNASQQLYAEHYGVKRKAKCTRDRRYDNI
jgi:hypothetical protein